MGDYGVIPEKPPEFPLPPEPVKSIYLTHAHLDHMGALPVYYHEYDAIFLTGYQVEGTNGRSLMENGTIKIAPFSSMVSFV